MSCPSFDQYIQWMRDRLPLDEAERVSAHIAAGCRACQSEQELAKRIVTTVARRQLVHAPRWLVRQAVQLFGDQVKHSRPGVIQRIVAALIADYRMLQPAFAVRYHGLQARRLIYQAGHCRIDISVSRKPNTRAVNILGESLDEAHNGLAGAEVQLCKNEQIVATTHVNPFGAFMFDDVPEGIYSLKIRSGQEIEIEDLAAFIESPTHPLVN
ncbi:MAG: carboxypeptidase-like regulatory domain-containing protein [Acidobacteriota bacterium]|nr:carboxypeptidase-like regulatory domain-containing protein [Blastocatellia bacterium]MDW8241291.1 carboxypeptidase-like regulatory domain-containing protein [Acidobacteriota bacterium]